jgi:hypothetical protein
MTFGFSAAVWSTLALCSFALVRDYLPRCRIRATSPNRARHLPVLVAPRSSGEPAMTMAPGGR